MRIGLGLEMNGTIDDMVARARALAATGVSSLWSSQIFGWDTLTALAVVGREVPDVTLGTAVIPVHPRHPTMLAAQALTVQAATGGRLVLGIGLSHQMVVEGMWGISFDRPARYMEEYLSILMPMLAGEQVSFQGEVLRANTFGRPRPQGATAPPVLVAALGPVMLGIAARQASGTITWMVGLTTLADHIVPTITGAAARRAARPRGGGHPARLRHRRPRRGPGTGRSVFSIYGQLPSYRAMLDREGAAGPPDVAIVGSRGRGRRAIGRFADAGATEFSAAAYGTPDEVHRTQALVGTWPERRRHETPAPLSGRSRCA